MDYHVLTQSLEKALNINKSFDLQKRILSLPYGEASVFTLAGLCSSELSERIIAYILQSKSANECISNLPCHDVSFSEDVGVLSDAVLSGNAVIIAEGCDKAAIADLKSYPIRSVSEPENDRVLRGPRDGFTESLIRNSSLIRRRLRSPDLIMERITVGESCSVDLALCYVDGCADGAFVSSLRDKLSKIKVKALNMTQESLAEALIKRSWYNPFPKVRYTERPDAAAAMLEEGSVIILCDNTPQAMILPTSIFDFLQETDDFYLPPLIGSYLRLTRIVIFVLSLFLTPLWYYCVQNVSTLPSFLHFLDIDKKAAIPLILQILLAEFMIDGLKLASLNTPNMLNNSLSVVGGLILGDYAVQAGWFSPQTILYMAIVAIAAFTVQSYELGYAIKFLRMILLVLTALLGLWGLIIGSVLTVLLIATNKTVSGGRSYLYPLIPFNASAFLRTFFRIRLKYEKNCSCGASGKQKNERS